VVKLYGDLSKRWGDCYVVLKGHQTMIDGARRSICELFGQSHWPKEEAVICWPGIWEDCSPNRSCQKTAIRHPVRRLAAWRIRDHLAATQPNWTVEDLADALGSVTPR